MASCTSKEGRRPETQSRLTMLARVLSDLPRNHALPVTLASKACKSDAFREDYSQSPC
jgi:hypothetical protein